jgi:1-acyl-sn-glycerol-3-phosphate acyltransferase
VRDAKAMVRKLIPSVFAPLSLLPDGVRRAVVRRFLDVVWGHFADIHVEGLSEVPADPVLYVCNHLSNADGLTLQRALRPRRAWFLAGVKLQQTAMTRLATETVDTIFIRPGSPDIEALRRAVDTLKEGRSILVFPEGGRSRSGALMRAQKGVSLIAQRAGVPIVPVALTGTEKLMPINDANMGGERLHRARIDVRFGAPLHLDALKQETHGAEDPRQALVDAVMRRLAQLLPPAYRGVYASEQVGEAALSHPPAPTR